LAHVWIDVEGQLKLLDFPLGPRDDTVSASPPASLREPDESSPRVAAGRLLVAAANVVFENVELCAEATDFVDALRRRTILPGPDLSDTLRRLAERRHRLGWDDRLGVLAVSWGIESIVLFVPVVLLSWLLISILGVDPLPAALLLAAIALAIPAFAGYAFRGGPVFRLTGIEVRRRSGVPAGRLRCAWRAGVAWAFAALGYVSINIGVTSIPLSGGEAADEDDAFALALYALAFSAFLLLHLLGAIYAVFRPRRGLQDILASTRLFLR